VQGRLHRDAVDNSIHPHLVADQPYRSDRNFVAALRLQDFARPRKSEIEPRLNITFQNSTPAPLNISFTPAIHVARTLRPAMETM
jgi:hypothetical protein